MDICYPSFNNQSIEAWPQDRLKISNTIDTLSPLKKKEIILQHQFYLESINLQFDSEGRISLTSNY